MQSTRATQRTRSARPLNLTLILVLLFATLAPSFASAVPFPTVAGGTVTDAASTDPIAGVDVYLEFFDVGMSEWYSAGSAVSGPDGAYTLYDEFANGAGEYRVRVWADGYVWMTHAVAWDGTTPVSVDLELTQAMTVASGSVTDAVTGDPVPDPQISAEFWNGTTWQTAGTATGSGTGTYSVADDAGFGAGDYRFSASAAGYLPNYVERTWDGATELVVDLQLERPLAIATGTVSDADTTDPIADAYMRAEYYDIDAEDWLESDTTWSAVDGSYTLSDLYQFGAGDYRFSVTAAGYTTQTTPNHTWNGIDPLAVDFQLVPIDPLATGSVTEAASGDPIADASIQVDYYDTATEQWWFAGEASSTVSGSYRIADGYFYGAGDYRFSVWADGYAGQVRTVTWDGVGPMDEDFALEATGLDAYEPDGTFGQAKAITVGAGAQAHTLFPAGDHDWVTFDALSGTSYVLETTLSGPVQADTVLTLYAADGTTVLAENDDWDDSLSRIDWTASGDQTVYLMARHAEDGVGTGLYGLAVRDATVPANQPPVAAVDAYQVDEDETLVVATPGVLINDSDADEDTLSAHLAANVTHGTLVLADDGGFTYEPGADYNGTDTFTYYANDGELDSDIATVTITVNPVAEPPEDLVITPIEGASRIDTAIQASQEAFSPGSADWVVIATGYNWPDALGGAALAGALDGPILLTKPDALPSTVLAEIARLGADNAIILGGTSAVSQAVEASLDGELGGAKVERIAGDNRYETARDIAARCTDELGAAYDGTAFLATGANFPDALGASPLAAAQGWPIYLVKPGTTADPALVSAMKSDGVTDALVLGGTSVMAQSVVTAIEAQVPCDSERLAGDNRYATACDVAQYGVDNAGLDWDRLAIATGQNFPDALAGGVLQGRSGSVMLLTPSTWLDGDVAQILAINQAAIGEVRFLGGTAAVSQAVRDSVASILE